MDTTERIAQFENMAQADPENEMAHYSLAGAYAQAGRHEDAAASYRRAIGLVPDFSKAYQLAAESLIELGEEDQAAGVLTQGYEIAARNGDVMPKNAMAALLEKLGKPLPEIDEKDVPQIPEGSFICRKSGRPGTQMERAPFRGPIGEWIRENISRESFDEWLGQGTKVINELRLDLSRDEDAETYDRYMHEYLEIPEDVVNQAAGA
jgi:Fe-S cluster biosynthesis and repair protein YggX